MQREEKNGAKINGNVSELAVDEAIIIPLTLTKESNDVGDAMLSTWKECLCMTSYYEREALS